MSPDDPAEVWRIGVPESKLALLREKGHEFRLARLLLVDGVVREPLLLIRGWDWPTKESCFVYAGKPTKDYRGQHIEVPPPPSQFFVVFVLPDGTIDYWNWRPPSETDPFKPEGIQGEVLWPKQVN